MSQPAEWGRRFQDLAAEAGQMSAQSLRRYQSLLERVSRGELKPDEVQKQFREYLQEQAGTSTREAVELSVGLLSGLLYAEARYREAMLDGLLPGADAVPPPPSPSGVDLTNWFQALATYAAEQSARAMARHQMLVERVAAGEVPAARVQEQARHYLETHAPEFLAEVMDLGLTFVGKLQRSSSTLATGLYDRVLGPDGEGPSSVQPPIVLELRGLSGTVVSAGIVVENARSQQAEVMCRSSEFAARAFGRRFRAALDIAPSRFTLTPGEQRDVTLQLTLDPSLFAPGADYVATLQISGADERDLIVQLIARAEPRPDTRPAPENPPPSRPPAAAASRAKAPKPPTHRREPVGAASAAPSTASRAQRKRR